MVALTVLVIVTTVGVACGGESDEGKSGADSAKAFAPSLQARAPGVINEVQERRAIRALTDYNDVTDAALSQSGTTLSLVLVVAEDVSSDRAKELGVLFVKMVKFHGPDIKPVQSIGPGNLDYVITVTYPDEEKIAKGAKNRIASVITWE
jgi:hypothetical protein